MKPKLQRAAFQPTALTWRKVWLGVYGGHYDIIVMFWKRPTFGDEQQDGSKVIDLLSEYDAGNVAADMSLADFIERFPGIDLSSITQPNGRPRAIEIPAKDLLRVELALPLDENGHVQSIDFHVDWR